MGKRETPVENYLKHQVESIGGQCRKYTSPGHNGVADRLVFLPGGRLVIIEVKCMNGTESSIQERERHLMNSLGFDAIVVNGKRGVDEWISGLNL